MTAQRSASSGRASDAWWVGQPRSAERKLRLVESDIRPSFDVLRAFLVEDSPVIRDSLVAALEEMVPLQVVGHAEDEAGAVAWLQDPANRCDIAIIDVFLKEGTGLGVLRSLERLLAPTDRVGGFAAVMLTNYATESVRRQCMELGAHRVFDKSSELDALVDYCQALG